jgi:hypothetical protein
VIALLGANPVNVLIDFPDPDLRATAKDNVDGDISSKIVIVNPVDTSKLGTYTVTYDVTDAAGNKADRKTRTVNVVPLGRATQTNYFLTGYAGGPDEVADSLANRLTVPSIDPAGITYGPSNHLFIVDSEMNEPDLDEVWTDLGGKNVFEVSLDGLTLFKEYALPGPNRADQEPTGIAYDATDGVFYVTNDITKRLYRYLFSPTGGFTLDDSVSTEDIVFKGGFKDVEGVTVDDSGSIYVIAEDEGKESILVYTYDGGFVLDRVMDLAALNHPDAPLPRSPEGIAFDGEVSGNLFVVSQWDKPNAIFEYTTDGALVGRYRLSNRRDGGNYFDPTPAFGTPHHNLTAPEAPHGITFGPATSGPSPAFYLADGGEDNGSGELVFNDEVPPVLEPELERDGVIYEGQLP